MRALQDLSYLETHRAQLFVLPTPTMQAYRSIFRAGLFEGKVAVVTGGVPGSGCRLQLNCLSYQAPS